MTMVQHEEEGIERTPRGHLDSIANSVRVMWKTLLYQL